VFAAVLPHPFLFLCDPSSSATYDMSQPQQTRIDISGGSTLEEAT
jgi:hypothetical protein